jgi:hypothetical protein
MRIATSPVRQVWLSRQAIWWRGDGDPAINWNEATPRIWKGRVHLAMIREERV